ncbi:hypothetical protein BV20DRAFT_960154 [Pilatotrama ljubarskyi]|nr:hypothetical protein BV20DRAFT_960154 [Pilatotrama ljubarskyi]
MEAPLHGTNGPPASQASGRTFIDSTNQPLRVFVEASELQNRPRVIRKLKNHGAAIRHTPDEACIILIDPQTASGGQFVQDWGQEPGKVVLDVRWVQESVKRGKAFLANENWGGFAVSENASNAAQNPLPTPRETPSDAQGSPAETMQSQQQYALPAGSSALGYQFQQPSQQPQATQHMSNGLPSGTAIPMAGMQPNPNAQVVVPAQLFAQLFGIVSQQGLNPASLGVPQMVPQIASQMPMNTMPGQGMPQGYPQQSLPFMTQQHIFAQPQYPFSQQAGLFPQQMISAPMSQMQGPDAGALSHYQSPTPATPDGHSSTYPMRGQSSISDTVRGSPMEDVRTSLLKRKSPSMDRGPRSAGKERADGGRSSKQRRVSYPTDEPPLPYQESPPPSTQPRRDPTGSHAKLFVKGNEEPYKFFVQIDIRPRTKIADAIKKNGGRLVPDIADADFVILGSPSTRTFEERLKQADNYGKSAVRPQWVFQCVEQNEIIALDDFLFEGMKVEKKRGRPSATGKRLILTGPNSPSTPKTNKKGSDLLQDVDEDMADDDEEDYEESTLKQKLNPKGKGKAAAKEPVKRKEKAENKADRSKSNASPGVGTSKAGGKGKAAKAKVEEKPFAPVFWRPSPPPPTRVVEHTPGKNMYTKEDLDYVDEYLPILFFRDPNITLSALSEKLHAKMPHHTQKSWQTHISHACRRDKYEKMRRQAHIARRKAGTSGQHLLEHVDTETVQAETPADPPSLPAPDHDAQTTIDAFDPFTVLSEFFAGGGADNLADSEVWGVLSAQYPQLSAQAWEAYWHENNEAVSEAVTRLSGVKSGLDGTEAPMQYGDGQRIPKVEPE